MKYPVLKETTSGWCRWQYPKMKNYGMACCDCGLVHTVQFGVVEMTKPENKKGEFRHRVSRNKNLRVRMRAKRNESETSKLRKRNKITVEQQKSTK